MNKYTELEKELAELLGWTDVRTGQYTGWIQTDGNTLTRAHPNGCKGRPLVPKWTSDNAAAFELMCDYEIPVISFNDTAHAYGIHVETYAEHGGDMRKATRVAIVKAVIATLKEKK